MRRKNQVIRDDIYKELLSVYPKCLTSSAAAKNLNLPTHVVRYYLEDMYKSKDPFRKMSCFQYYKPKHNEYRAIP